MAKTDKTAALPRSQSAEAANARIETLEKLVSTLRHDLRGAISSTSLVADALLTNADPAVQRSGQRIITTIERILTILNATLEIVPSMRDQATPARRPRS